MAATAATPIFRPILESARSGLFPREGTDGVFLQIYTITASSGAPSRLRCRLRVGVRVDEPTLL